MKWFISLHCEEYSSKPKTCKSRVLKTKVPFNLRITLQHYIYSCSNVDLTYFLTGTWNIQRSNSKHYYALFSSVGKTKLWRSVYRNDGKKSQQRYYNSKWTGITEKFQVEQFFFCPRSVYKSWIVCFLPMFKWELLERLFQAQRESSTRCFPRVRLASRSISL